MEEEKSGEEKRGERRALPVIASLHCADTDENVGEAALPYTGRRNSTRTNDDAGKEGALRRRRQRCQW